MARKRTVPRAAKIKAALEFRAYRKSIMKNTRDRGGFMVGAPAKDGTSGHQQWAFYKDMWKRSYGPNYLKDLRREYRRGRYR